MFDPRADFILQNTPRLVTLATRCAWSFGAADGINNVLKDYDPGGQWRHPAHVLHRDTQLMAALRVAILLDADHNVVSFQTVYHGLKEPDVQAALLGELEKLQGPDVFATTRPERIEEFLMTYREIDWQVHSRLTHFRNLGIAHLATADVSKSVTIAELRTLVGIVSRLAATLQALIETKTAFHEGLGDECREEIERLITLGCKTR